MMDLNKEQQAAVVASEKNILVIAPPGSGKTRVIIERAAYLMEHGTSPYEIVLVTFTRLAANEIRERLVERVGNKAYHATIGTFHAIALNLLHRFGDVIGFKKSNITVYGDFEEQYLLKEVAKQLGVYNGKSWKIKKGDIDEVFAKYYEEGIEPDELNPVHDLFNSFFAACKENQSYTYGGLLMGMKELLPHIHQYLNLKHVILDEAHDTDKLQWELLRSIQEYCDTSLFAVADLDQSIYSFRGAYPEYILNHQNEFTIYRLSFNYRSRASIVEAANSLIQHNTERLPMTMVATRECEVSSVFVSKDMDSENILTNLLAKLPYMTISRDTAVLLGKKKPTILSRNHSFLIKLSQLLEEARIEHRYIGKETKLTNSEEFRRFHAFLKLIVNPYDNFAFLLIKDIVGLTSQEYCQIRQDAATEGKSHFEVFHEQSDIDGEWYNYSRHTDNLIDITDKLCFSFGMSFDVKPIMEFMGKYSSESPVATVQPYLDWLATIDIQDEVKEDYDGLTLMTIHAAKGLEWETVIVAGCNEEILPSKQAIREGNVEEERRLMYVAMTRARDTLILTVRPEVTEINGRVYENPVSRFIGEMT
jgi:DNA helicase-2/ATP-dependent DNA helicase PcrA